jgi:hypothetical protein
MLLDSGEHSFMWDAGGVAPGTYVCVVRKGGMVERLPIVLVK